MAEACLNLSCPEAIRFALMDPCTGEPVCGAENGYALSCPRNLTLEPIVREGETSEFVSDCGYVVVRDRQDDQLQGWTISFEHGTRSNELEALLTGKTLIASEGENIGTYQQNLLGCPTGASPSDPRFIVELFYQVSRCTSGADHVRFVIPNVQFKITEMDKEGQITFFRYNGESSPSLAVPIGNGAFNDFPVDVEAFITGRPAGEMTTNFDFEETITIVGSCGTIEVPCELLSGIFIDNTIGLGQQDGSFNDIACDLGANAGKYVAVGNIGEAGNLVSAIYRFNANGQPDTTFGGGDGKTTVYGGASYDVGNAVAVDPTDGTYLMLATQDSGGTPQPVLLRFTTAGILDAGWGVGGAVTIPGASASSTGVWHGLHIEASGEIVVAWKDGFADGHVSRLTQAGAAQDDVVFAVNHFPLGIKRISDGFYAVGVLNGGTGEVYASIADLGAGTHADSLPLPAVAFTFNNPVTNVGVGVEVDSAGRIYLSGTDNFAEPHVKVARFDPTLVLDPVWGGGGLITIEEPSWDASYGNDVIVLASGDVVISGHIYEGPEQHWLVAKVDTIGSLIPTFGVGGIVDQLIGSNVLSYSNALVACGAETRIVSAGIAYDPAGYPALIGNLTTTGALDTTFGEP